MLYKKPKIQESDDKEERKKFAIARANYYKQEDYILLQNNNSIIFTDNYCEDKYTHKTVSDGLTKYIVWVKNHDELDDLMAQLLANQDHARASVGYNPKFILIRKIKVFETDRIRLNIKESYQTKKGYTLKMLVAYVKKELEREEHCLNDAWKNPFMVPELLDVLKSPRCQNAHGFTRRLYTGHRYEISCFDKVKNKTINECLGNIVIIVSDKRPDFVQGTTKKKERKDTREMAIQTRDIEAFYYDE